jgi:hypothetical protein
MTGPLPLRPAQWREPDAGLSPGRRESALGDPRGRPRRRGLRRGRLWIRPDRHLPLQQRPTRRPRTRATYLLLAALGALFCLAALIPGFVAMTQEVTHSRNPSDQTKNGGMARPGFEPGTPRFSGTRRWAGKGHKSPANRQVADRACSTLMPVVSGGCPWLKDVAGRPRPFRTGPGHPLVVIHGRFRRFRRDRQQVACGSVQRHYR